MPTVHADWRLHSGKIFAAELEPTPPRSWPWRTPLPPTQNRAALC